MDYFEQARINMVNNQIMPNRVNDERVLDAFYEIPRHLFIEEKWQGVAYFDGRIPLSEGRFLLPPEVFAKMINALQLTGSEKALDIACGSGYTTAILSKLVNFVVGIESIPSLALKAANNLVFMNIDNIAIKEEELFSGAPENAPYDCIIINGAVTEAPKALLDQMGDGGKLVMIKKLDTHFCKAVMLENHNGSIGEVELFDCYAESL